MSTKLDRKAMEELLPWYAAGTLDAAETAEIEAALAADPVLRQRLEDAREEMGEAVLDAESLGSPSPRALDLLMARIEAEPRRAAGPLRRLDLGARLAGWLSPRTLGWTAALAALVVVVQAGIIARHIGGSEATYRTASAPQEGGLVVIVAFQPAATAEAIATTLAAARAGIVAGPSAEGLYRLRVGDAGTPPAEARKAADALKADTAVIRLMLPGH